jgi:hypothetical protein
MDDDLMSLRSNVSSSKNDDDDLLGGFGSASEPSEWTGAGASADLDFGSPGEQPAWLRDLEVQPDTAAPAPAAESTPEKKKKSPRRPRKSGGKFLGLTPQQRTILALFLFLEVAVVSILVLFVIGAINIP